MLKFSLNPLCSFYFSISARIIRDSYGVAFNLYNFFFIFSFHIFFLFNIIYTNVKVELKWYRVAAAASLHSKVVANIALVGNLCTTIFVKKEKKCCIIIIIVIIVMQNLNFNLTFLLSFYLFNPRLSNCFMHACMQARFKKGFCVFVCKKIELNN